MYTKNGGRTRTIIGDLALSHLCLWGFKIDSIRKIKTHL